MEPKCSDSEDRPQHKLARVLRVTMPSRRALLGLASALIALVLLVLLARLLLTSGWGQDFVARYPGTLRAANTPDGIPVWLAWQHYLNLLFLVLIVRTGLNIRSKQRPPGFYRRRNTGVLKTKGEPKRMSVWVWLHLSIDALWVLNGVIYVVLLFATGQWLRLVPTSWSIAPNAVSAGLQYLSFQWPADNPWVAYNALQQLSYFVVVFIAAPLAILTGLRLSSAWPLAARINRWLPEAPVRRLHSLVLWFFIAFVIVHVTLVLTNGPLRNLNAMFAGNDGTSWLGVAVFALASLSAVALWFLVRPAAVKAVASRFGEVR